jgi:hypothetical protein
LQHRLLRQVRLTTKTSIRKPDGSYESRGTIEYADPACPLGAIANIFRHGEPGVDEHRFYQKMGCTLDAIDRFAYPDQPAEVQLLWWKALTSPDTRSS